MSTKSILLTVGIATATAVAGFAIGSSAQTEPEPKVVEKTVEVEVEKPVEVIKEVEKEVEVETTTQSCLDALDAAEVGFGLAGDGFDYAAAAITAAGEFDIDGIEAATDGMVETNDSLDPVVLEYNSAAADCRASR